MNPEFKEQLRIAMLFTAIVRYNYPDYVFLDPQLFQD